MNKLIGIMLIAIAFIGCSSGMDSDDHKRRQRGAEFWAAFVADHQPKVTCQHPDSSWDLSTCLITTPNCKYLITCNDDNCTEVKRRCKAELTITPSVP